MPAFEGYRVPIDEATCRRASRTVAGVTAVPVVAGQIAQPVHRRETVINVSDQ